MGMLMAIFHILLVSPYGPKQRDVIIKLCTSLSAAGIGGALVIGYHVGKSEEATVSAALLASFGGLVSLAIALLIARVDENR